MYPPKQGFCGAWCDFPLVKPYVRISRIRLSIECFSCCHGFLLSFFSGCLRTLCCLFHLVDTITWPSIRRHNPCAQKNTTKTKYYDSSRLRGRQSFSCASTEKMHGPQCFHDGQNTTIQISMPSEQFPARGQRCIGANPLPANEAGDESHERKDGDGREESHKNAFADIASIGADKRPELCDGIGIFRVC